MRKEQTSHKNEHNTLMCFPLEPVFTRDKRRLPNFIDEPTNALDEKTREQLRKILSEMRAKGKLIVISCHDTEDLEELSDEIIEIKEGKVVSHWSVNADEES